jgi:hypothetical protein
VLRHLAAFEQATHRPREVQEVLLRRTLAYQADTDFGHRHGFGQIRTVAEFRRHLGIYAHEYFEPYIARVQRGGSGTATGGSARAAHRSSTSTRA